MCTRVQDEMSFKAIIDVGLKITDDNGRWMVGNHKTLKYSRYSKKEKNVMSSDVTREKSK